MREINKLIIHCTASDVSVHDMDAIKYLRKWHVEANGWNDIGYHFCISKTNGIQFCRPIKLIGAHTHGENEDSIGIVLTGNEVFSQSQFKNLEELCAVLCFIYELDETAIFPHSHFNKGKTCPNFAIEPIRWSVKKILSNKRESYGLS